MIFIWFFVFAMLFDGGLIPSFFVVRSLGLLNTLGRANSAYRGADIQPDSDDELLPQCAEGTGGIGGD